MYIPWHALLTSQSCVEYLMFLEHLHFASPGKLDGSSISDGNTNCVGLMAAAALTKVSRGESDTSNSLPPEQTLLSLVSDLVRAE